jgi:O-antigen ligase
MIGTGALSNPLLTSHVFGFFCIYWITSWMIANERKPWLALLLALPLAGALLATGSRTPLMALTLTCLWMLLMAGKRALAVLVAIALACGALAFLQPDIWLERGASFRPQLWSEALRQAGEQLWMGKGYGSSFVFKVEGLNFDLLDPHNVALAVLLELGLIGLTLWLIMFGLALFRCLQLRHEPQFQLASALIVYGLCAGMAEGSNFLSRPNENWFIVWIPVALFAALSLAKRQSAVKQ